MVILLFDLFFHVSLWAVLAIGGANVTIADMQRYVVADRNWVTETQFLDFISIAQAAPGPNGMGVVLIGLHVAGLLGLAVTLIGGFVPTSIFTYYACGWVEARKTSPIVIKIKKGLLPITVGLFAASSVVLVNEVSTGIYNILLTIISFAIAFWTKVNPIWLVGASILIGSLGILK